MAIRPIVANDLDALWKCFQDVIRDGATYVQDETTSRDEFVDYWTGRGGEQWVIDEDHAIAGGYTVRRNQPGRGAHVATASYIIAEGARGRKLGQALGEHSLDRARALGFSAIQFNFVVSTNEPAVRLWTRLGFSIVGRVPGAFKHPHHGLVDVFVMHRPL